MDKNRLLCIGHRGAMGHAPENTLLSFRKALELGAACVEADVYCVDDQLMVFHDDRLERTTNGSGYLRDHGFEYLRSLDAGEGQQIPTLRELFETVNLKAGINIELKGPGTAGPVVDFIAEQRQYGWHDGLILVSSFDHGALETVRKMDAGIRIGVLMAGPPSEAVPLAVELGAYSVHLSLKFMNRAMIRDAHSMGLRVFVFTVNRHEDIRRMETLGADGVFTNYPERVSTHQRDERIVGWP
jgi:glycerophosphoryl diester phosphodiesterase